jgi:oligopeptide/dipeptide ABC transporter ATP-binding protein
VDKLNPFRKKRSVKAVNGVNLAIKKKEICGLVGESGCGKSTLARMFALLDSPTEGVVNYLGKPVTKSISDDLRSSIQIVFQNPKSSLNPRTNVEAVIDYPLKKKGVRKKSERLERSVQLLEGVGLSATFLDRYRHQLSGGEAQRVCIARALVMEPEFLVCDEPTSALDMNNQAQIYEILLRLNQTNHLSLLYISHNISTVEFISDYIAVMYLGFIVEKCSAETFKRNALHPYSSSLLDAIPRPDPSKKRIATLKGTPPSPVDLPSGCPFHPRCERKREIGSRCEQEIPEVTELENNHQVRCHLYS